MEKVFEWWSVGNGDVAVYTEDPETARTLRELLGKGTIYEKAGKVFGWQFTMPKRKQRFVEARISKKFGVESKGVTAEQNLKFDIRAAQKAEADD